MTHSLKRLFLTFVLLTTVSPLVFAQGGAGSSLTGVVVDTDGGVIPGATVNAKNEATAAVANTVTGATGTFVIPALGVGTYTVTVSLQGFKTVVLKGVVVSAGTSGGIRAVLEIGGLEQTVTVEGAATTIQTQASSASNTLNANQIINLPGGTRNALDFVAFLPGVQTSSTVRNSQVNGLPQSTISITMDGISIQDNYLKSTDGFFARMSPRLDAVEEVTLITAGTGADANAQGATQIKFTTRSGTDKHSGSAYWYMQSDALNSNTWANVKNKLPKPTILQNQPGFRVGGPVEIPHVYDGRGKMFYFFNYEELHQPSSITTSSNLLTTSAQQGIFQYSAAGVTQSVNLYSMAAGLGLTSTPDPLVAALLADIRSSTAKAGTISPLSGNFLTERLQFVQDTKNLNRYPTIRMDYNLTQKHHMTGSYNRNNILSTPDTTNTRQPTFPGFPSTSEQASIRYTWSGNLRSTLAANLVNDLHIGGSGGPTQFSPSLDVSMFNGSLANQGGYGLSFPGFSSASPSLAYSTTGKSSREGSTKVFEDTLNWVRGAHSISAGGGMTQADIWLLNQTVAPTLNFGTATGDPATASMFTAANFPNSSTNQRGDAQALYNMLTGRLSSISGTFRLNPDTGQYEYNGDGLANGRLREFDFFAQDNWRLRPNLSLNVGLRYVLQNPFYSTNSAYSTATLDDIWGVSGNLSTCDPSQPTVEGCNLFKPGALPGKSPTFQNFGKGSPAYNTDLNNFAPSIGVNWTPEPRGGFFEKVLGPQGTTSFQGGWNRSFNRRGMADFTDVFGANPGLTTTVTRSTANGNLGTIPHLIRDGDLGPAPFCATGQSTSSGCVQPTPSYPMTTTITGSANIFDPNLQIPYSDTYTVGIQRQIGKKSAVEARYVGTRYRDSWTVYNMNEVNIIENGFLEEFKLAQKNLAANNAAGGTRAGSFAYFGTGTGTSPLPTYLAYFSGVNKSLASDAARYTSTSFTNSNFVNALALYNSNPFTPAGTNANTGLGGDPTRRLNASNAGLPSNFFIANPDLQGGANVTGFGGYTTYNSFQTAYRRRLSAGLQFDANYAFGRAWGSQRYSFRVPRVMSRQTGTVGDVTHGFKFAGIYELPFGRGKKFGSDSGALMHGLIGDWSVSGAGRIQSGRLTDLGNVRVVGMSVEEAQKAYKLRKGSDGEYYMWPQDIIDNSIKAYSTSPLTTSGFSGEAPTGRYFIRANGPDCIESVSNTYGDCGVRSLVLTGPTWKNVDLTIAKRVSVVGRSTAEIHFDILNAFKIANLTPVTGVGGTALSSFQITATNPGDGASQRVVQIQARFNF